MCHYSRSVLDADSEAAETIKQAQSERAKGIQNLQDQLKEAKILQDKADEALLFEKVYNFCMEILQKFRFAKNIDRVSD